MPICSYVVHPKSERMLPLMESLKAMKGCEVTPAVDHALLLLVTETESAAEENDLQEQLKQLEDIECLALAFGEIPASPTLETKHE